MSAAEAGCAGASPLDVEAIKREVRAEAERAGFEACGFTTLDGWEESALRLDAFIERGHHDAKRRTGEFAGAQA